MEALAAILAKLSGGSGITFDEMSPRDFEQFKVDTLNNSEGTRHLEDGYHCSKCKNKGYIMKLEELPGGQFTQIMAECKCAEVRRSILRMKKSGMKDIIKDYTFDKFEATEPWQQTLKAAAMEYATHPEGWFFIGGQSGAGKSHLCTAICREFLLGGRQVVYMLWRDDVERLKGLAFDEPEEREKLIGRFKKAEVLYIDDLFKMGRNQDGSYKRPTSTDINLAFEIINFRGNAGLLTIVSSEWSEDDLLDIDEATGGRIFERAKSFSIAKDRSRNYRTRKTVTV